MIDPKRYIGPVLLVCLAFSFLLSYAGSTLAHPAKPSSSTVHRDLGHIPPVVPLLLAARSQPTPMTGLPVGWRANKSASGTWSRS